MPRTLRLAPTFIAAACSLCVFANSSVGARPAKSTAPVLPTAKQAPIRTFPQCRLLPPSTSARSRRKSTPLLGHAKASSRSGAGALNSAGVPVGRPPDSCHDHSLPLGHDQRPVDVGGALSGPVCFRLTLQRRSLRVLEFQPVRRPVQPNDPTKRRIAPECT
jgi:hypothetical protein